MRTHGETHVLTPSFPFPSCDTPPTLSWLALPFSFFFSLERIMMCWIIG